MDEKLWKEFVKWFKKKYPGTKVPTLTSQVYNGVFQQFLNETGNVDEAAVGDGEESSFGVVIDPTNPSKVKLPDGQVIDKAEWDALTDEEKLGLTGVAVVGDNVYFMRDGKLVNYKIEDIVDIQGEGWAGASTSQKVQALAAAVKSGGLSTTGETSDYGVLTGTAAGLTDKERAKVQDFASEMNIPYEEALTRLGFMSPAGTEDAGMTEWQKFQMGQVIQDRADAFTLKREEQAQSYSAQLQDRLMTRRQSEWEIEKEKQQRFAEEWEELRQGILADLGNKPANWIKKYQWETKTNPYQATETPEQTAKQWSEQYKGQIEYWQLELDNLIEQSDDRNDPLWMDQTTTTTRKWLEQAIKSAKLTLAGIKAGNYPGSSSFAQSLVGQSGLGMFGEYQDVIDYAKQYARNPNDPQFANLSQDVKNKLVLAISEMGGQMTPTGVVPWETPKKQALGMPSWLQSGVEGSPTTVAMKNPAEALTPSGQWWNRLAPAQQEMWGGYAEHAGQRPTDLLWGTQVMSPKNLQLGKTWKSF